MGKKLTYEFVKASFEKEGCKLLSAEYKNNYSTLEVLCIEGHKYNTTWNRWSSGIGCSYCSGNAKPVIAQIEKSFSNENYKLLSDKYINSNTKLEYICDKGHRHSISWTKWRTGRRCPYCSKKIKKTIEEVKASFESEEYILLSTEYVNTTTKLSFICSVGHEGAISYCNWQSGWRCAKCHHDKLSAMFLGPGNHNWKGGISFEPYCEAWKDKEYKSDIRDRDGNRCLNPYCDSKDPSDLTIHHIDYDKKNCHPSNLITVCRSCNSKANTDRTWHKYWYQAIIYRRSLV